MYGLSLDEFTLAELLKPKGYDTMAIGKWHLGHSDGYQPASRGFDSWYGVPYSWDLGCADGKNGVDWHDGVCSTSHKRYGCPTWWGDDNMCKGCAAQVRPVVLVRARVVVRVRARSRVWCGQGLGPGSGAASLLGRAPPRPPSISIPHSARPPFPPSPPFP